MLGVSLLFLEGRGRWEEGKEVKGKENENEGGGRDNGMKGGNGP